MIKILSLGWGVQSFTIAAMVALGELEPIDFAIHADTTHERKLTYDFVAKWKPWLESKGLKIITVVNNKTELGEGKYQQVDIPAFTRTDKSDGQVNRQCTGHWKIEPMRRRISQELTALGIKKTTGVIKQWIGISIDEYQRMRDSDVKYIANHYPLIEKKMTRKDCEKWLINNGLEIPPKSACTFCPFHSTDEWRKIKATPEDWKEAVLVDSLIRDKRRTDMRLFVHPSRKPLDMVDFRTQEEKGQLSLWDNECTGICGV
jgi:hypothetical protein